ncbi:hypothetical protein QUF84_00615 [Fictibacillus enclensis]|uniref:hypothetical protein n=1 Tax=Fictibacillus enclensis TaxID=1017270 RepID=UPI0025A1C1CF|nr:hypothetical protein [Fictibacillus enclensis]MDM5335799.1 hypothetical protein [Fictibacillus enclensis]
MNRKKALFTVTGLLFSSLMLAGCGSSSVAGVEKGETYMGKMATDVIIEADSNDSWTVKSKYKDDANYSVVDVKGTGDKVGDYPVINVKATKIIGDIDSQFAKREGRDFITVKDKKVLYFIAVGKENIEGIESKLKKIKDKDDYIKGLSNYKFIVKKG